jgi:hypothetical protein
LRHPSAHCPHEILALIGFVFPEPEGVVHFHNTLLNRSLSSFWAFEEIGFELALFFHSPYPHFSS